MIDIKWEEPPANGGGRGRWTDLATALRARPGAWALIADDVPSSLVSSTNKGRISDFQPAGAFQARGQTIGKNRSRVWARYVADGVE